MANMVVLTLTKNSKRISGVLYPASQAKQKIRLIRVDGYSTESTVEKLTRHYVSGLVFEVRLRSKLIW
jgi:hypothetical protein